MSWYNNNNKLKENLEVFFKNKEVDYNLLEVSLRNFRTSEKNKERSSFLSSKKDSTQKQKIRHELNCEDFEYKSMIVQECINKLSDVQNN